MIYSIVDQGPGRPVQARRPGICEEDGNNKLGKQIFANRNIFNGWCMYANIYEFI